MGEARTHAKISRRHFLKGGGALLSAAVIPGLPRLARAGAASDPVLVAIYLRGAADGLNLVVPAGDPDYYALRPRIAVTAGSEIALDGFFALNPTLGALKPLYDAGELAILHAAGSPDGSRSHFDAQDFMELGTPGSKVAGDGWLNRTLAALGTQQSWSGISIGSAPVLALQGAAANLSFTSIEDFRFAGSDARRATLSALYQSADSALLTRAGEAGFDALDVVGAVTPGDDSVYPSGPFGAALADAAALIKGDIGVRTIAIDIGGWDHHENEETAMAAVAPALAAGLAAFRADLGSDFGRVCAVAMTEFGRTAAENGSLGTDHGHGAVMLGLGGGVAGGQVLLGADGWPGLGPSQLFEGRDLAVTTDFRDVFAELLNRHMGLSLAQTGFVLPGHEVATGNFPGLLT